MSLPAPPVIKSTVPAPLEPVTATPKVTPVRVTVFAAVAAARLMVLKPDNAASEASTIVEPTLSVWTSVSTPTIRAKLSTPAPPMLIAAATETMSVPSPPSTESTAASSSPVVPMRSAEEPYRKVSLPLPPLRTSIPTPPVI